MADPHKRLDANRPGNFYVDATCINCDACRQLAPASFEEVGDYSAVVNQPVTAQEVGEAYRALLARGVSDLNARGAAAHLRRWWRIAKHPAMSIALPDHVFDAMGLPRLEADLNL